MLDIYTYWQNNKEFTQGQSLLSPPCMQYSTDAYITQDYPAFVWSLSKSGKYKVQLIYIFTVYSIWLFHMYTRS